MGVDVFSLRDAYIIRSGIIFFKWKNILKLVLNFFIILSKRSIIILFE